MPTLIAMAIASLAAWLVESATRALFGSGVSLTLGFVFSTFAFFYMRRLVSNLRGGS